MEKLSSAKEDHSSLVNIVFSWTIQDALNEALFKYKVVFFPSDSSNLPRRNFCNRTHTAWFYQNWPNFYDNYGQFDLNGIM